MFASLHTNRAAVHNNNLVRLCDAPSHILCGYEWLRPIGPVHFFTEVTNDLIVFAVRARRTTCKRAQGCLED